MLHALGKEGPDAEVFQKRLLYASRANLILGIVVLLLTSIARAAQFTALLWGFIEDPRIIRVIVINFSIRKSPNNPGG